MTRRRRQGLALLTVGLVLMAAVVAFFIAFDVRDDRALREGRRTPGQVVGQIQPQDWDLFDCGRIVVSYELDGVARRSTIWIDTDLEEYPIGSEVTVVVHGSFVRTADEPNDPQPLGFAAALVGIVGLGVTGVGGSKTLRREHRAPVGVTGSIPLKTWRLSPRKARIDVLPDELSVYLPAFFGPTPLSLPRKGTVVEYLDHAGPDVEGPDVWFKDPVRSAYFPTGSVMVDPDLVLALTTPAKVPPLRRTMAMSNNVDLPFTRAETTSAEGVTIDAVALRVADLAQARHELAAAGIAETSDSAAWMVAHRELETDPDVVAELKEDEAVFDKANRIGMWLTVPGVVLLGVARFTDGLALAVPGFVLLGLGFVVPWVMARLRTRKARSEGR
jgi:hypothetical protein